MNSPASILDQLETRLGAAISRGGGRQETDTPLAPGAPEAAGAPPVPNASHPARGPETLEAPLADLAAVERATLRPEHLSRLIALRSDLIRAAAGPSARRVAAESAWAATDRRLRDLLVEWCGDDLLDLGQVPVQPPEGLASIIVDNEQVHPIATPAELDIRLGSDRSIFTLGVIGAADRPLAFIEVAYTNDPTIDISQILAGSDPSSGTAADTAVFYSINRCEDALGGVDVGRQLILAVARHLGSARPEISRLITLSPMPGFRSWLDLSRPGDGAQPTETERSLVDAMARDTTAPDTTAPSAAPDTTAPLAVAPDHPTAGAVVRAGARYLAHGRSGSKPLDGVARFHLSNGARIERLSLQPDPPAGIATASAGLMVNYRYEPELLAQRQARLAEGEVTVSPEVAELLDHPALPGPPGEGS